MKLSIIVITRNEDTMLPGCLKSVQTLAEEVIVVDSQSTDKTRAIAQQFSAQVISVSVGTDYASARNSGLKIATGDWLLYLDADERLTPELIKEIKSATSHKPQATSYRIPRKNIIFGQIMRHGGYWPDYVHRLFKKQALIKWTGKLHESPTVTGSVGLITQPIIHYTARSVTAALEKSRHWAEIEAQLLFNARAPKVKWWKIIKAFVFHLFNLLILKRGLLDGMPGFILAYIKSFHQASVLVNLWQLQQ